MSCFRMLAEAVPAGETVESSDHLHLEPIPRVVQTARRFVAERLPAVSDDTRDVLMLLTSELVTNAVIHARTPLEVGLTITDRSLLVTVHDQDLGHSALDQTREGGWGLGVVASLSEASAMTRHFEDGKTAWFRVTRDDDEQATA
jgi:anti-sigma regulatory factor (Ser/Thr protein kinase)